MEVGCEWVRAFSKMREEVREERRKEFLPNQKLTIVNHQLEIKSLKGMLWYLGLIDDF